MLEKALLLTGDHSLADDRRAGRLLEFFGVPYQRQSVTDFRPPESSPAGKDTSYRLVCAAQTFARVMGDLQDASHHLNGFTRQIHSVFLYSHGDPVVLANVVGQLYGTTISIRRGAGSDIQWRIANDPDSMCGAMRDLRIHPSAITLRSGDFFHTDGSSVTSLIAAGNKAAFLKLTFNGVTVFVSSERLIDIDADLATPNFDVRDHFFSAVPAVSYIRWAFAHSAWRAPEASACLVIDDPLLKARYGFVRFRELLALMKQHRFSTSIAFIPWNWRRNDRGVVKLFRDNPGSYSLCIHGCDHTRGEFGTSNRQRLRAVATKAARRMSLHERRTGLAHDRVMVFPQGVFSAEAIPELKRASFHAVVNTEVHSNPPGERKLRISDVWDVAVMSYGDFPIYTRRYPAQGVENLAFDLLLGKPCLVVIHHDFCRDGCGQLVRFIDQLNALKAPLTWRPLGDVVRHSYRQKELSPDSVEIEMYGAELRVKNRSDQRKRFIIRRRESEPTTVKEIRAESDQIAWNFSKGHVVFEIELNPGESRTVSIKFHDLSGNGQYSETIGYKVKTLLRRYLSEARDNYVVPTKSRLAGFVK
ncbi:MAG: hypothetical protein QOH31_2345 [Verrucomicrobiota bacterium]